MSVPPPTAQVSTWTTRWWTTCGAALANRRDRHSADAFSPPLLNRTDAFSPPLLKHLLKGEGGCSRMTELSPTAIGATRVLPGDLSFTVT